MPVSSQIQAGQRITASMLNGLNTTTAYKVTASSTAVTTNTFNDPDLVLPLVANATYRCRYALIVSASVAGAGIITQFSLPSGSTQSWFGLHLGGATLVSTTITTSSITSTTVNANTNQTAWAEGIITTSTTAGNWQTIFYNTGTAATVTMQPGSFIEFLRIA